MKEHFWLMTLNSRNFLSFTVILYPPYCTKHTHKKKLDWCFSTYHSTLKILANILKLLEFGTWTILIHINHNNDNKTKKNSIKRLSKQGRNRSVRESIWRQNGHFHIIFVSTATTWNKTGPGSLLNDFKNIPGKVCLNGVDNNDTFVNVVN